MFKKIIGLGLNFTYELEVCLMQTKRVREARGNVIGF